MRIIGTRLRDLAVLLSMAILLAEPVAAQLRPANSGNFASADSAATTYSNPAGLTRLDRPEVVLGSLFAYSRSKFEVASGTTISGGTAT
jgi:long-chain fatty acid transport protein